MFIPPPLLLGIAIALSYLVSLAVPGLHYNDMSFTALGLVLVPVGVALFLWGANTLNRHKTTLHPRRKPTKLVAAGPYGWSRNPIYLGFFLIAVGTALLFANVLAFVGPLIFFAFINTFIIPFEESMLTKSFGKTYASYKKKTRRWV
jgi:protein-S-isoprenylcysteine O-methyltransferase Ste14